MDSAILSVRDQPMCVSATSVLALLTRVSAATDEVQQQIMQLEDRLSDVLSSTYPDFPALEVDESESQVGGRLISVLTRLQCSIQNLQSIQQRVDL